MNQYNKALLCAAVMVCMYGCLKYMYTDEPTSAMQAQQAMTAPAMKPAMEAPAAVMEHSLAMEVDVVGCGKNLQSKKELDKAIEATKKGKPMMLRVSAHEGCPACDDMNPVWNKTAKKYSGKITFLSVYSEEYPFNHLVALSKSGKEAVTPTFIGYKNGKRIFINEDGVMPQKKLDALAEKLL